MSKLGIVGKAILEHYPNSFFTLDQLAELTEISRKYLIDVLVVFSQEGLIKKVKKQRKEHIPGHAPCFSHTYRVANRRALADRLTRRVKAKTIQDKMWALIRGKRHFILTDLIVLAGAKRGMARWFLKALRRMDIIQPSRAGGGPGVEWTVIGDVGPKRPCIKTKRGSKGRGMEEKVLSKISGTKRDVRIHVRVSRAEAQRLKDLAAQLNLSASGYVRMLLNRGTEIEEAARENF